MTFLILRSPCSPSQSNDNHYQGFWWRYAPVRRTGTFFSKSRKKLFIIYILNE